MDKNEHLSLVALSDKDSRNVYDMLQGIAANENEFKNEVNGMPYAEFPAWIRKMEAWSKGEQLPDGYVPQTIFLLYDGEAPVGMGKIRHRLTDYSRKIGGNIGYAISAKYRGKGYGTELMRLLALKADEMGVDEKLATVEIYNPASRRAIEKAGGRLVKETAERWYFAF
jgi:predicted acetyltransferase